MLGREKEEIKIVSYIEHYNKYGMGEKYTPLDRIDVNKDYYERTT